MRPQGGGGSPTATDHHPFWADGRNEWVNAADIQPGETLRTPAGTVQIGNVRHWTGLEPAFNLTVDDFHTYFVLAGDKPVLVHNTSGVDCYKFVNEAWEELGPSPAGVETSGLAFNLDGTRLWRNPVVSGKSETGDAIDKFLQTSPDFTHPGGYVSASHHAESKFAWAMRNSGEPGEMRFVINKDYICPKNPGPDALGCQNIVPAILYEDQSMRVFFPGGPSEGKLIRGTAKRR
ncbi:DddA-like double-stranded DNA deaminase toxin [Streptomyces sp. NRRL S-448]|uniref:DddA-like double-stranded DNA deaminase toxin n=1 Tax=Streptomyces sp. NRRL S-448 TaxID=1463907 RepID=UPI003567DA61